MRKYPKDSPEGPHRKSKAGGGGGGAIRFPRRRGTLWNENFLCEAIVKISLYETSARLGLLLKKADVENLVTKLL